VDEFENKPDIDELIEDESEFPEENSFEMKASPPTKALLAIGSKKLIALLLKKKVILYILIFAVVFFVVLLLILVISASGANGILPYEGNEKCENVTVRYVPYNESEASSSETMSLEEYVRSAVYQYVSNIEVPTKSTGISEIYYSLAVTLRTEALNNGCTVTYRDKKLSKNVSLDSIFDMNLKLSEGVILTDSNGKLLPAKVSDFCWNESLIEENSYKLYQANSMRVSTSFVNNYLKNDIYRDCACNKYTTVSSGECGKDKCFTYWPVKSDDEEEEDSECYRAWLHQDDTTGFSVLGAYYLMMEYAKDYNEILRYFFGDLRYMTVKGEEKVPEETIAMTNCSEFSLTTTSLTREEFVSSVQNYSYTNSSKMSTWNKFVSNAGHIYDMAIANNTNPEMIIVRGILEGFSPGEAKHNYFGLSCYNGQPEKCSVYPDFDSGIMGFITHLKRYDSYTAMTRSYAYLGDYWYNPGTSADGGCYYAKYIYPDGLDDYVLDACSDARKNKCFASGDKSGCVATREEDKNAYSLYQGKSMTNLREKIFGISSDSCSNNTLNHGNCVLYKQNDSRWGSEQLGYGSYTLGNAGCAVTSVAIALTCTGEMSDVTNFSPSVLNKTLKENNGFKGGAIYWDNEGIRNFVPTFKLSEVYTLNKTDASSVKIQVMRSGLGPRTIGIVHILNSKHLDGHFVVLQSIDEENNTIHVLDPAYGDTYVYSINDVDGFKYYTY